MLPKISIITPSYNQSHFIEKTINSVLDQHYPNLEYIVIDGGSTDHTISILKKYKNKVKWISRKDNGQTNAINKGLVHADGDIIGYLNSDDILEQNCLMLVAKFFQKNSTYQWVTGKCYIIDKNNYKIRSSVTNYKNILLKYFRSCIVLQIVNFISQPATFWRKKSMVDIGVFNEKLNYSMDYDYWIRLYKKYKLGFINQYLASFRIHADSKSFKYLKNQLEEDYNIARLSTNSHFIPILHKIHNNFTYLFYNNFT